MKRLSPRLRTAQASTRDTSDERLPDDVVSDQLERLEVFSVASGGPWGVGLLMDAVVYPAAAVLEALRKQPRYVMTAKQEAAMLNAWQARSHPARG